MGDFTGVNLNPNEAFVEKTKSTLKAKEDRFVEENRLHKFASYNYVLTLSALSRTQMANPDKILSDTPHDIIARTGGIGKQTNFANETDFGGGDTKDQNIYDEFGKTIKKPKFNEAKADFSNKTLRKNRDIYFERVEIDSYPRPNTNRKLMNYTKIEMALSEPNGITLWEKVRAAARNCGYIDHTDAPFLLTIEFKGYDSKGDPVLDQVQKRFLPIRLVASSLQMNAGGTTYTVSATPWTEFAMVNSFLYTRGTGRITGKGDNLESYLASFQTQLNKIMRSEVDRNVRNWPDTYKITADPKIGAVTDYTNKFQATGVIEKAKVKLFFFFTSTQFSKNVSIAKILEDFVKQFPQYSKIDQIAERYWNAVGDSLTSTGKIDEASRQEPPTPWVPWFKIITTVTNETEYDFKLKSHRRTIHYHIQPCVIHVGNFARAGMGGYPNWNDHVKKKYNYIYTGENLDILDLNVEYNAGYYLAKLIDGGSGEKDNNPSISESILDYFGLLDYPEANLPLKQFPTTTKGENPEQVGTADNLQAQQFYDYLTNPQGDMVNVDMKIMGDPAFLGQDYMLPMTVPITNFYVKDDEVASIQGFAFDSQKGCFNFDNAEPIVSLNFKFPSDFDEGTGLYEFTREATPQFTGIYRVNRVVSVLENGQFTQNLEMTRFNNQTGSSKAVRTPLKEKETDAKSQEIILPEAGDNTFGEGSS